MVETLVAWPLTNATAALDAVEIGERRLELAVQRPLAGDDAARRHGRAEAVDRGLGGFRHRGVLIEAQIVVGGEIDVAPTLDRGLRPCTRVVAPVEGIGDAEQVAQLTMLDDGLVRRQIGKAVGALPSRVVLDGLLAARGARSASACAAPPTLALTFKPARTINLLKTGTTPDGALSVWAPCCLHPWSGRPSCSPSLTRYFRSTSCLGRCWRRPSRAKHGAEQTFRPRVHTRLTGRRG